MAAIDQRFLIEIDLRGAAEDSSALAIAWRLIESWSHQPPNFDLTLRAAGSLDRPVPPGLRTLESGAGRPVAILAFWPVWPLLPPAPLALYVGGGAEKIGAWDSGTWRARRADLVLVPSRREKVELQVLRQFDRGRTWALDARPESETIESALVWLATGSLPNPTGSDWQSVSA
jgi:hypothetical protein